jgi:hypothetical protein
MIYICWFGRYSLNIWDVRGHKAIWYYWRNYFERTDGLVWVVDSSDIGGLVIVVLNSTISWRKRYYFWGSKRQVMISLLQSFAMCITLQIFWILALEVLQCHAMTMMIASKYRNLISRVSFCFGLRALYWLFDNLRVKCTFSPSSFAKVYFWSLNSVLV